MPLHNIIGAEMLQGYTVPHYPDTTVIDAQQVFDACKPFSVEPGSFRMTKRLGKGSHGDIYRCILQGRHEPVAAKKLKDNVVAHKKAQGKAKSPQKDGETAQAYTDLVTELVTLARVGKHPNVVEFYGACISDKDNPIIFEELLSGASLASVFSNKGHGRWVPSRSVIYEWSMQLLQGLEFLHNRDPVIIHRDIKPGNLLLSSDMATLKIGDFGMCKMVRHGHTSKDLGHHGTVAFMAPEVFHKHYTNYTPKVDIYSAAVIMWYIATGHGHSFVSRLHSTDDTWRPDIEMVKWGDFKRIIQWAWAANPDQRPTASELLAAMRQLPQIPPPINPPTDFAGVAPCITNCSVQ